MSGILQTLIYGAVGVIKDAYFNLVTLLLNTTSTNGAQNNTFLDSSSNNFTITRNGNTTQGTFTPFSQTGWSNFFAGTSGQYLNTVANTAFNFGTGDFTVEGWVFPTSTTGTRPIIEIRTAAANSTGFALVSQSGASTINVYTNGAFVGASTNSLTTNAWNHVALTRSGNTWTYWINGVSGGSFTNTSTQSDGGTTGPKIGGSTTAGEVWIGYLSNIRITKGGALYTSTFTPSTTPLTTTVSAGTVSLLTCQSNRFLDNSSNAFAITVNGTPSVQAFSPFAPTTAYDTTTVGGSGYFDGTGDHLVIAANAAFNLSTTDWTIQGWYYPTSYSASNNVLVYVGTSASDKIVIATIGTAGNLYYLLNGSTGIAGTAGNLNSWNHFALVKSGATTTLYLNGASVGTTTSVPTSSNKSVVIGTDAGAAYYSGYISSLRILNGSANTGVPTAPYTAITNTSLLLNCTNAGIYDASAKNDLETVGNAQVSTTQAKFGGSSILFNGTSDYLFNYSNQAALSTSFGSGDYTIEMWVRFASTTGNQGLADANASSTSGASGVWFLYKDNSGNLNFGQHTVGNTISYAWSPSANTWYHVAVCRSGTTVRLFINGTQASSATDSANWVGKGIQVGIVATPYYLNGYIDDFRITKGYARYTTNFTPPSAAFPVQ